MLDYDIKFLTCEDSVIINKNDLKTNRYESKKRNEETIYDIAKRNYYERRGRLWRACRPQQIRKLESKLRDRNIVICEWTNDSLITIIFSSGVIAYITVRPESLDVTQILFDRYCVGKLSSQLVTGAVLCKTHLLFTHAERLATLVTFGKDYNGQLCRISEREPHIQVIELGGSSRRIDRHVSWCEVSRGIRVLVWSPVINEPAPWSPGQEDLANLHVYNISGQQVSLTAYHQLENEILIVSLSQLEDNIVHIVEQTGCQKRGVRVSWSRQGASGGSGGSGEGESVLAELAAPVRAARLAPSEARLALAALDGSLHVMHSHAGLTHITRAGFIATDVRWAGELIVAAEDGGRVQCYDRALTLLNQHTKCLDLSSYLRDARRMQVLATRSSRGGPMVLLSFVGGPLTLIHIKHPELMKYWVSVGAVDSAVSLLRAAEWARAGGAALRALATLVGCALRNTRPNLQSDTCSAEGALGAFLSPSARLPPAARRYAPHVHDLARKYFHHLLRRGRIEKALSLGVELASWELFADARHAAQRARLPALALEAAALAQHYAQSQDSECSDSCSQCSSQSSCSGSNEEASFSNTNKNKPPPLPRVSLSHQTSNDEVPSTANIMKPIHQYLDRSSTAWSMDLISNVSRICDNNHDRYKPINQDMKWRNDISMNPKQEFKQNSINANDATIKFVRKTNNVNTLSTIDEKTKTYFNPPDAKENAVNSYYINNNYHVIKDRLTYKVDDNTCERIRPQERNKVKFSDTVTVTVMSEASSRPEVSRELAESLPLSPPHKYLAVFAPRPSALAAPPPAPPPPGTTHDYVEV